MASLEYMREVMNEARRIADDRSQPAHVRHAADARFWHCVKRFGTMERGGLTHDEPGHYMKGYRD